MKTMHMSTLLPELTFDQQKPIVMASDLQLSMWEEEINFYHRLLTLLLHSCYLENQSNIEVLLARVKMLREVDLPVLKALAQQLPGVSSQGYFQRSMEMGRGCSGFSERLNTLKCQIFKGFTQFGHVQIW